MIKKSPETRPKLSTFPIPDGDKIVSISFDPFIELLNLKIGDPFLFQHWNKITQCFGIFDLGSNLYHYEYKLNQIDQRGHFSWRMVEVSPTDTDSPLVACNYCKGYSSILQLPEKLILIGG